MTLVFVNGSFFRVLQLRIIIYCFTKFVQLCRKIFWRQHFLLHFQICFFRLRILCSMRKLLFGLFVNISILVSTRMRKYEIFQVYKFSISLSQAFRIDENLTWFESGRSHVWALVLPPFVGTGGVRIYCINSAPTLSIGLSFWGANLLWYQSWQKRSSELYLIGVKEIGIFVGVFILLLIRFSLLWEKRNEEKKRVDW